MTDSNKVLVAAEAESLNSDREKLELLARKLRYLESMLMMTWGNGGEAFRRYNEGIQDTYCWACHSLASECVSMVEELCQGRPS